jgi:hypothetical protein
MPVRRRRRYNGSVYIIFGLIVRSKLLRIIGKYDLDLP